jgi:hypothetical protein
LALNDDEWDAFVGHLDRMRVPRLMRREPPQHSGCCRGVT